ncbi:MAG: sulfite exporter TauE/SafE family protein [Clostridia bacterium]|nr:sulfite exporter TauE/SafE family protein [Clostridia bacterium]
MPATELVHWLALLAVAYLAGAFGALLGLGGGIFLVPFLTLGFGLPIRHAVAASLVGIIATSTSASSVYLRQGIAHVRLGLLLETGTAVGALAGAWLAGWLSPRTLAFIFSLVAAYTAVSMVRHRDAPRSETAAALTEAEPPAAGLHGRYWDAAAGRAVSWRARCIALGVGLSSLAGVLSSLVGVGGGTIKVPVMNLVMGVPIKAATATSNFMIGITGAASAFVYAARGDLVPIVAGFGALGVTAGARSGAWLQSRLPAPALRWIFALLLLAVAGQVFVEAWRGMVG